jgi:hypothetical protein
MLPNLMLLIVLAGLSVSAGLAGAAPPVWVGLGGLTLLAVYARTKRGWR